MILVIVLFLLVLLISLLLAYRSMRDFRLTPTKARLDYGLFLIRNPDGLTKDLLDTIHADIAKNNLIFSLERLFRGNESALVIFGPKNILKVFDNLNLLELEDYTKGDSLEISAWEVGLKNPEVVVKFDPLFENLPQLNTMEQFWWQVNCEPLRANPGENLFSAQIRCVLLTKDLSRQKKLSLELTKLGASILSKIPQPFTSQKILEFYKMRSITRTKHNLKLKSVEVLQLVALTH